MELDYESKECLECGCIIHPKVYFSICYDDGGGMECIDHVVIPAPDICDDCQPEFSSEADTQVELNNFQPPQDEFELPF